MNASRLLARAVKAGVRKAQPLLTGERMGGRWILAYHLVGAGTGSPVDISRETFRAHLELLESSGAKLVPLERLLESSEPDSFEVALTFDDAFGNFVDVVAPLLDDHSMPATLFVPTEFVDGQAPSPLTGAELPPCSWADLRMVAADGRVRIGSHTRTHSNLRTIGGAALTAELRGSRRRLEDAVERDVRSFCYPQAKWNRAVRRAVAEVYDLAVVGGGRPVRAGDSPWSLPRVPVHREIGDLRTVLSSRLWLEEAVSSALRQVVP